MVKLNLIAVAFTFALFTLNYINCALIYYQNYEFMNPIKLLDYKGYYGYTKIQRFTIPDDVLLAIWRLQITKSDNCPTTTAYFYLDYSGYPVIAPNNETFPPHYTVGRLTKVYLKEQINTNKLESFINVSSPYPGQWFSSAFIDNSNNKNIKPDLFRSNCTIYLTSSVNLWRINDTKVLDLNQNYTFNAHLQFKFYKYITSPYFNGANNKVYMTIDNSNNYYLNDNLTCMVNILLRRAAFPDLTDYSANDYYTKCKNQSSCEITVNNPLISTWYYVAIESNCNYTINIMSFACNNCEAPIETFRFVGPAYFMVKYYFNSNNNNRSNALYLYENKVYFVEMLIDQANNGGTFNLYLINNMIKMTPTTTTTTSSTTTTTQLTNLTSTTTTTTTTQSNGTTKTANNTNQMQSIVVNLRACFLFNSMQYDKCADGYEFSAKSNQNSDYLNSFVLNIAYPMVGKWYLALWKECYDRDTNQTVECPSSYIPYSVMQLSSDQCANDYCGDYGTCYISNQQYMFSACKCTSGYQGYGCTDARFALSKTTLVLSLIFLTTSNLIFILPIAVAIYKRLYVEALIYFYNMFFSTFYHACDQDHFSFCIFNYDGLQLADFIGSYTSFTITILSMSTFERKWKVFTFFVGLLACLSINLYDRFNSITFVVLLCVSVTVTVSTWVRMCYVKRELYPKKMRLLKFYLPGIILAIAGLVIYTFLQTKSNYYILHSIWHICMAISIVFFLEDRRRNSNDVNTSSSVSNSSGETNASVMDTTKA